MHSRTKYNFDLFHPLDWQILSSRTVSYRAKGILISYWWECKLMTILYNNLVIFVGMNM